MHLSPLPNWNKVEAVEDGVKHRVWMHRGTKRLSFLRPEQDKVPPLVAPPTSAREYFKIKHPELKKTDLAAAWAASSDEEKKECDARAAVDLTRFNDDALKAFALKAAPCVPEDGELPASDDFIQTELEKLDDI